MSLSKTFFIIKSVKNILSSHVLGIFILLTFIRDLGMALYFGEGGGKIKHKDITQ